MVSFPTVNTLSTVETDTERYFANTTQRYTLTARDFRIADVAATTDYALRRPLFLRQEENMQEDTQPQVHAVFRADQFPEMCAAVADSTVAPAVLAMNALESAFGVCPSYMIDYKINFLSSATARPDISELRIFGWMKSRGRRFFYVTGVSSETGRSEGVCYGHFDFEA